MKKYLHKNGVICGVINPNGVNEDEKRDLYNRFPNAEFTEKRVFDGFLSRYVTTAIYKTDLQTVGPATLNRG